MRTAAFRRIFTCHRWSIAVLLGGTSAEREISLQSGQQVVLALQAGGHRVVPLDPLQQDLREFPWSGIDVAFIALHGTFGEDGTIQALLDHLGIPYTGSGAGPSALAFDKPATKTRFLAAGLPTPPFRVVTPQMHAAEIAIHANELGYPLAVKPAAQGSSLGVTILPDSRRLQEAVAAARALGEIVLLEQAIAGEEWTVPVLDDLPLDPIRIGTSQPFFNFEAKYQDAETRYDVVTPEQDATAQEVQTIALQACLAAGCRGMSRVDLRVDHSGQPWLLEINTVPGLTDHSLVPKSARARGWSMLDLCEGMIASALGTAVGAEWELQRFGRLCRSA